MAQNLIICDGSFVPLHEFNVASWTIQVQGSGLLTCTGSWIQVDATALVNLVNSPSFAKASGLLSDPAFLSSLDWMVNQGGVDWTALEFTFGGGLTLFAVGAGVGLVINVVKKLRP